MRTKEQIEELVVSAFGEFASKKANLTTVISWQRRDFFVKRLRVIFNDLRLPYSLRANNLKEFSEAVFAEQLKKQEFFEKVRCRINEIAKKNYASDSVILEGEEVNSLNFFFDFSKILNPLIKEFKYSTDYSVMRQCRTPYQLADMFYRRGRF